MFVWRVFFFAVVGRCTAICGGVLLWLVYRVLVVCCGALYGVWWRLVAFRVASCGAFRLSSSCGACRGAWRRRRFVCRVVGRGVCCSCRRAGRGAARVSPCVSCRVAGREAACLFHVEGRGAGPVLPVSVFYPPAPGEGVQSRFCRWGVFFALKWGAFFRIFLLFSIWFSTLKNPRGLFFPRGCSLYGCDGGYLSRFVSIVAAMLSAVSAVRSWVSSSRM